MRGKKFNDDHSIRGVRKYLAAINLSKLQARIANYERLARTPRTPLEIHNDIYEVLMHKDSNGNNFATFPANTKYIPGNSKLFRARIIDSEDSVTDISHVWEAPPVFVRPGRLNAPREPLIYTSVGTPVTACHEVRMKPGQLFAMIQYTTKLNVSYAPVGGLPLDEGYSASEFLKLKAIYAFMEDIFTQRTGPSEEHIYLAPEILVKNFYDWPAAISQAWGYTSIAKPGGNGFNLCFRPELAKAYTRFETVMIGRCTEISDQNVHYEPLKELAPQPRTTKLKVIRSRFQVP